MAAGAQWNVGGAGQNSGANVGGLTVGSGYTVNYNSVSELGLAGRHAGHDLQQQRDDRRGELPSNGGRAVHDAPAVALATWQEWFGLWYANIDGSYQWDYNSEIPYLLANGGIGENLDWQLAPVLTGFYYGYMATGDPTTWMDGELRGLSHQSGDDRAGRLPRLARVGPGRHKHG